MCLTINHIKRQVTLQAYVTELRKNKIQLFCKIKGIGGLSLVAQGLDLFREGV